MSSSSAMPVSRFMRPSRSPMMNTALQMIAQVTAISRTMSVAAVRWRRRVERMGRMCMGLSYCDLSCSAGAIWQARQAGTSPARTLEVMASAKVVASMGRSSSASAA